MAEDKAKERVGPPSTPPGTGSSDASAAQGVPTKSEKPKGGTPTAKVGGKDVLLNLNDSNDERAAAPEGDVLVQADTLDRLFIQRTLDDGQRLNSPFHVGVHEVVDDSKGLYKLRLEPGVVDVRVFRG